MSFRKVSFAAVVLLLGVIASGCAESEIGSAPVVKVTPEQRAKDMNAKAESTVKWLESLPPAERQAAIGRTPQIAASLKAVADPALKARIDALGVSLP